MIGLVVVAAVGFTVFRSIDRGSSTAVANSTTEDGAKKTSPIAPPTPAPINTPPTVNLSTTPRATGATPIGNAIGALFGKRDSSDRSPESDEDRSDTVLEDDLIQDVSEVEFTSWADLNDRVEPSVVRVNVTYGAGRAIGSGFVLNTDGVIVTNYHVIAEAQSASVTFANGDEIPVRGYVHLNHRKDIALLKIEPSAATTPLRPLPLFTGTPRKGSEVAAFGAPQGLSFSFSKSTVSAYRSASELRNSVGFPKDQGHWVQHAVPISGGSSGGPLVNKQGQVIGINTMTLTSGQSLNFGISSNDIRAASEKLINLVAVSPSAAPDHDNRHSSAGGNGPGETGDNPYFGREASLADETETEKGRQLLAEMEVMNLAMLALEFDQRRIASGAVQEKLRKYLKSADVDYAPFADQPVILIVMTLEPLNGKYLLWLRATIIVEDSSGAACKAWEQRDDIGTLTTSTFIRGSLPRKVDRAIDSFFRRMRTDIVSARQEQAQKAATSAGENEQGAESDASNDSASDD